MGQFPLRALKNKAFWRMVKSDCQGPDNRTSKRPRTRRTTMISDDGGRFSPNPSTCQVKPSAMAHNAHEDRDCCMNHKRLRPFRQEFTSSCLAGNRCPKRYAWHSKGLGNVLEKRNKAL